MKMKKKKPAAAVEAVEAANDDHKRTIKNVISRDGPILPKDYQALKTALNTKRRGFGWRMKRKDLIEKIKTSTITPEQKLKLIILTLIETKREGNNDWKRLKTFAKSKDAIQPEGKIPSFKDFPWPTVKSFVHTSPGTNQAKGLQAFLSEKVAEKDSFKHGESGFKESESDDEEETKDPFLTLQHAIREEGEVRMLALLTAHPDLLETIDESGNTPLLIATKKGWVQGVIALTNNDADLEVKDESGKTPLLLAAENDSVWVLKVLLDKGANTQAKDNLDETVLMKLSQNPSSTETIFWFLNGKTIDINAQNNSGLTALIMASKKPNFTAFEFLINHGKVDA